MPENSKFVDAYETATGRKTRVPAHWLDHPVLKRGLSKTPRRTATDDANGPSESWTNDQLTAYARKNDIDLGGATRKADLLAAITTASSAPNTAGTEPDGTSTTTTETPAAGDN